MVTKETLEDRLKSFFSKSENFEKWWVTKNMFLEDKSPEQLCKMGKLDEVVKLIELAGV